jgi:hypothetical protein
MANMTRNPDRTSKEYTMKKIMLFTVLTTVFVLAFAATATADTYIAWDASGVNLEGPHADYQTGTTKCAVCHSVHAAPVPSKVGTTGGVPWTAGTSTEMLLRSTVADSCRYCHIDTAVGGVQIYWGNDGTTNIYGTAPAGHTGSGGSACVNCHAVHGAKTYKGGNEAKIIKLTPGSTARPPQPETIGDADTAFSSFGVVRNPASKAIYDTWANAQVSGDKYRQQTVFCSSCHWNFAESADTTIGSRSGSTRYYYNNADVSKLNRTHAMVAASTAFSATNAGPYSTLGAGDSVVASGATTARGGSNLGIAVAFAGSSTCRACHDAGAVDGGTGILFSSFPHYTQGSAYLLTAGAHVGDNSAIAGANVNGNVSDPAADGSCLKCHKGTDTTGVGFDY